MGKDCDYEKIFDDVLSEALNDYIEEESAAWEAEMMSIPEPQYSPKYKRFINRLLQKSVHPVMNWKKWTCIAAAVLGVCIFITHESTATYREIYKNKVTKETDVSFDIKLKPMYIEYDLSEVPDAWEYVYLPNDIMIGFEVEEMYMEPDIIKVVYSDKEGQTVKYSLYHEKIDLLNGELEPVDIKGMEYSYVSYENGTSLIMETKREGVSYTMLLESDTIEIDDLIWIANNLKMVHCANATSYYKE